jgi:hypothetical protein
VASDEDEEIREIRNSKSEIGNGKINPTLGNLFRSGIDILKD